MKGANGLEFDPVHTDYVYLEFDHADDEPTPMLTVLGDTEHSFLSYWTDAVGIESDWVEELRKHKQGSYKIEYTSFEDDSDWESGRTEQNLGSLVSITPARLKGAWLVQKLVWADRWEWFTQPFRKCWVVDFCDGHDSGGVRSKEMWLPRALYRRFIMREGPWGKTTCRHLYGERG